MSVMNYNFYKNNDGLVYKNDIEEKILNVVKEHSDDLDDYLLREKNRYILGDLTCLRENLLNWYPFEKTGSCLEIGAGMGALTPFLAKKMRKVTSIEMTECRAKVIQERTKNQDNVEIILGNMNDIELNEKFDYVVIVGVLEYARRFIQSKNPPVTFLEKVKSFLKPNGILLLAIENKFGLRYLAGAGEEHTKRLFLGLNTYDEYDYVRTFSKSELKTLFELAGFQAHNFFYPFPDYGMPSDIYTDEGLKYIKFGHKHQNLTLQRYEFFNETRFYRNLQEENIATNFSHHFLIEVFNGCKRDNNILFVKSPTDKNKLTHLITSYEKDLDGLNIYKYGVWNQSRAEILYQSYARLVEKTLPFIYQPMEINDGKIKSKYLDAITLADIVSQCLDAILLCNDEYIEEHKQRLFNVFKNLSDKWRENTCSISSFDRNSQFIEYFGEEKIFKGELLCVMGGDISLTLNNFKIIDGQYFVVDYENIVDFPVPVEFLIYNLINTWFEDEIEDFKNARKHISLESLYEVVGIERKYIRLYKIWRKNLKAKLCNMPVLDNIAEPVYTPKFLHVDDISAFGIKKKHNIIG